MRKYEEPVMNVLVLEAEDVITLSYGGTVPEGGGPSIDADDLFKP